MRNGPGSGVFRRIRKPIRDRFAVTTGKPCRSGTSAKTLDASEAFMYQRDLKFYLKVTTAVTKMAKLSLLLPAHIPCDRSHSRAQYRKW